MTHPTSLRLPSSVKNRLEQTADARRESASALAVRLIDEGLRMDRFPGVGFHDSAVHGRVACILRGPDLAEVMSVLNGLEATGQAKLDEAATWLGLTPAAVSTALDYYAEFRDEIDSELARRTSIAAEERARYDQQQALLR